MSTHGKTPKSFNEGVEGKEASWAPLPTRHILVLISRLPAFGFFVSCGGRALEHSFELILLLRGQADSKGGDEPGYGFWYRVLHVSLIRQLYRIKLFADQVHVFHARSVERGLLLLDLSLDALHLGEQILECFLRGVDFALQSLLPMGQAPQGGNLLFELDCHVLL